jgi:ribosome maturation factor RimP
MERLTELVASAVEPLGYELLGVEYLAQGHHSLLRIYIDSPDGITLDDCERASRQVSAVLDVDDPIRGQYTLEMSSPGLDRPLFTAKHFTQFIGHEVKLRLHSPLEGRRKFKAVITSVEGDLIHLTSSETDEEWQVSLDNIDKANLVPEL